MQENAGFLNVKLEDVWWDVGVAHGDEDHHRPDITCEHPKTHAKYVFDLVVWRERGARRVGREPGGGCSGVVEGVALPAGDVGMARRADVDGGHGGPGRLRR